MEIPGRNGITMINIMVRGFLGEWGQALLNFYQQNSFWINAIILLYFLIVIFSQNNYKQTLTSLILAIEDKYPGQFEKKTSKEIARILSKKEIPWQAVLKTSKWPLIATPRQLYPRPRNESSLKKLITLEILANSLFNIHKIGSTHSSK
jgi:hypothetical protein